MTRRVQLIILALFVALLTPGPISAIETAPRISDREIIERLTKLEEGQKHLEAKSEANAEAIAQLRQDIQTQIQQLRQDMNAQFDRLFQLTLGILGAFVTIVAATIGFAL